MLVHELRPLPDRVWGRPRLVTSADEEGKFHIWPYESPSAKSSLQTLGQGVQGVQGCPRSSLMNASLPASLHHVNNPKWVASSPLAPGPRPAIQRYSVRLLLVASHPAEEGGGAGLSP